MVKRLMTAAILCTLVLNFSAAQENKIKNIEWEKIRAAFKAYCESPSVDSAKKILFFMPVEFDNRAADFEQWVSTSEYIYEHEPFIVLENLIRKGDNFAIRIAFRTLLITDGAFTEDLCSLISESIQADPTTFLEEADRLLDNNRKGHLLNSILRSDNDIDTLVLEEDMEAKKEFSKEIQLRVKSLKTVTRPKLQRIRDICIGKLEGMLRPVDSALF